MGSLEKKITEDVSERIWSLFGQSVHAIIERSAQMQYRQVSDRAETVQRSWVRGSQDRWISTMWRKSNPGLEGHLSVVCQG